MTHKVGDDRRKPRHLKRIGGDIDRDLAERFTEYVATVGVGKAVILEAAIKDYLNRYERDRDNPRPADLTDLD